VAVKDFYTSARRQPPKKKKKSISFPHTKKKLLLPQQSTGCSALLRQRRCELRSLCSTSRPDFSWAQRRR
ncbi:hypothetical protein INR49_030457, partial [Caranx melampygus]